MTDYKKDFPLLAGSDIAYLDNAATAQRPEAVLKAVEDFYTKKNANPLRGLYELGIEATEAYEAARERVREFINAGKTSEVVFTRNSTESLNLIAYSYGLTSLKAGDEILISIDNHHSNILPWQMVSRQTGAKLVYLECQPDGSYRDEDMEALVTEKTKIAAMPQISNVLGRRNPVEKLTKLVHEKGGVIVIDAAQSAPHIPVDVQALDADFLVFSGHKLMAPMGIGVLYGKEALLDAMPPFLTGGEMIDSVSRESAVFAELPHKFEAGTVNGGGAVGLQAAIDYLMNVGFDEVRKREELLTTRAMTAMQQIPGVHIQEAISRKSTTELSALPWTAYIRTISRRFWMPQMSMCAQVAIAPSRF
ncbi:MAG: aminotransferase class V-fold PLP-dependent enzyme [Clostridium fessum]